MEPVMRADGLCKEFVEPGLRRRRVRAVDGVSFDLQRGEVLAVIGESGCGKSTLARLLTGLLTPTSGSVRLGARDLTHLRGEAMRTVRQRLQPIFQDAEGSLDPRMRVRDLLVEPLRSFARPSGEDTALALAESASLTPDLLDRYPHQLSGGQRQRIGFARALCLEPEIVVADEPAASLDPSTQAALLLELDRRRRGRAMAVVLISHNLRNVRLMADRVAVMYLGRLVEVGPAEQVFADPHHPYTRTILATMDVLAGRTPPVPLLQGEPPSPAGPPRGCHFHPRCPQAFDPCALRSPAERVVRARHRVACHLTGVEDQHVAHVDHHEGKDRS